MTTVDEWSERTITKIADLITENARLVLALAAANTARDEMERERDEWIETAVEKDATLAVTNKALAGERARAERYRKALVELKKGAARHWTWGDEYEWVNRVADAALAPPAPPPTAHDGPPTTGG